MSMSEDKVSEETVEQKDENSIDEKEEETKNIEEIEAKEIEPNKEIYDKLNDLYGMVDSIFKKIDSIARMRIDDGINNVTDEDTIDISAITGFSDSLDDLDFSIK